MGAGDGRSVRVDGNSSASRVLVWGRNWLVDHFHAAVGGYAIAGDADERDILVVGLDYENASHGIVLWIVADGAKRSVTAVDVQRKGFP